MFCGASTGNAPYFAAAARELGRGIAEAGMRLVYGGGRVGLMGEVADAAVQAGGVVIGVIPEFLTRREVAHDDISELIVTPDMHTRKRRMFELSDAFVSFAGGLGTLDETFEILTWRQLKLHDKPVLVCDVGGAAAPLLAAIEGAIGMGFARPENPRAVRRAGRRASDAGVAADAGRASGGGIARRLRQATLDVTQRPGYTACSVGV